MSKPYNAILQFWRWRAQSLADRHIVAGLGEAKAHIVAVHVFQPDMANLLELI